MFTINRDTLIFIGVLGGIGAVLQILGTPRPDEVWLLLGLIAVHIAYWLRSDSNESYWKFAAPILVLIIGGYIVALKTPKILSGMMPYGVAQLVCLAIYGFGGWLIVSKRAMLSKEPNEGERTRPS